MVLYEFIVIYVLVMYLLLRIWGFLRSRYINFLIIIIIIKAVNFSRQKVQKSHVNRGKRCKIRVEFAASCTCLLYTSDAADE